MMNYLRVSIAAGLILITAAATAAANMPHKSNRVENLLRPNHTVRSLYIGTSVEIPADATTCGIAASDTKIGTVTVDLDRMLAGLHNNHHAYRDITGLAGMVVTPVLEPVSTAYTATHLDIQMPPGWVKTANTYSSIIFRVKKANLAGAYLTFIVSTNPANDNSVDTIRAGQDDSDMFCGRSQIRSSGPVGQDAEVEIGVKPVYDANGQLVHKLGSLNIGLIVSNGRVASPNPHKPDRRVELPIILDPKVGNDG